MNGIMVDASALFNDRSVQHLLHARAPAAKPRAEDSNVRMNCMFESVGFELASA